MTSDIYPTRRDVARRWTALAERQLRTYEWQPTPAEQEIAWNLGRATRIPSKALPPHTGETLPWRLLCLTPYAPAIRLAMAAGGWTVPDDGIDPPGADTRVDLPGLLSALYPVTEAAEQWSEQCDACCRTVATSADMEAAVAAQMVSAVPSIEEHVSDLELLWGGVGMLLYVIASGDVDG